MSSSSSKRKPRLSISKKIYKDKIASPLINSSPQHIPCSPSPSAIRVANENCSTPVTSKKRCYFLEESPSQDYDIPLSQMPIPLSQDTMNLQCTVDVGWRWQSPKASGDYIKNITRSKSVRDKYERAIIKPPPELRQEPQKVEIKGFFKFQEELQKLTNERPHTPEEVFSEQSQEQSKPDHEIDIEQLLESLDNGITQQLTKSNLCDTKISDSIEDPDEITIMPLQPRIDSQNENDKDNKCIAELLDDSDFALMKCSQEIEQLVMEHQNIATTVAKPVTLSPIKPISYLPAHLKQNAPSNEQFDDSFDDFLSSIPLDDIISSQDSVIALRHNVATKHNTSLTRHKSMPLENNRVSYQVGFAVSKQRMSAKKKISNGTNFEDHGWKSSAVSKISSSSSSTSTSGTSSYKKCSSYEIEMKRHEAMQKLEARRKAALVTKK